MGSTRALARLGVVVVLVAASLGSPAAANGGRGVAVCPVCGDPLERAAADAGVPLSVEGSELTVRVHENGSARWTARVEVNGSAAARLRADPASLERIVADVYRVPEYTRRRGSLTGPEDPSIRIEGDTVVVSYRVEDVAHRGTGGVLLVDFFHSGGEDRYNQVHAQRVVIRGPDGWRVVNRPPGASVSADGVVWTGDHPEWADRRLSAPVPEHTYVALAPDGGPVSAVLGQAAIASEAAPFVLRAVPGIALAPCVLAAGLVGGLVLLGRRERLVDRAPAWSVAPVAVPVAGLAGLGAVATRGVAGLDALYHAGIDLNRFGPVVAPAVGLLALGAVAGAHGSLEDWLDLRFERGSGTPDLGAAVAFLGVATLVLSWGMGWSVLVPAAAAYAALGISVATVRWPAPFTARSALVPVAAALAVGGVVGVATGIVAPANGGGVARTLGYGVPPFLLFPLGVAVRRGSPARWGLAAAVVAGPVLVAIPMGPQGAFFGVFWYLLSAVWMIVQAAFGLPLYVLGRAVAGEGSPAPSDGSPTSRSDRRR